MKPYQVKLRIVGVLSIILAVLAASLPLPSKAAGIQLLTDIQNKFTFTQTTDTVTGDVTIWLIRYLNDDSDNDWVIPASFGSGAGPGATTYLVRFASDGVFRDCDNLETVEIDEAVFSDSSLTSAAEMFKGCTKLTSVVINPDSDPTTVNTSNLTNMDSMFEGCSALTTLDITPLDTENVTSMNRMFQGCGALTSLDVSTLRTDEVLYMNETFADCAAITDLDLSAWTTPKLQQITGLFSGCTALKNLDMRDMALNSLWDLYLEDMFTGCNDLEEIVVPKNIPSTTALKLQLPYEFQYTDGTGTQKTESLPYVTASVTMTRSTYVKNIFLNPVNLAESQSLLVGNSTDLTVTLTPAFAANTGVTVTSGDPETAKLSVAASGSGTGTVDSNGVLNGAVGADGTLTVSVTGIRAGSPDANGNPQPAIVTITVTSKENSGITANCDVTVVPVVKPVTGIGIVPPASQELKIKETMDLQAAIMPVDASNHHVTWTTSDDTIVSISGENAGTGTLATNPSKTTITAVKPGSAIITATSNSSGQSASILITVVSPYDIYTNTDHDHSKDATTDKRKDCNNTKYTTVSADNKPVTDNLLLNITTPNTSLIQGNSQLTTYSAVSTFTVSITDDAGNPVADDLGNLYITMALPGNMQPPNSIGKTLVLYEYAGGVLQQIPGNIVGRTSFDGGSIDAVIIRLDSTKLAQEYAFAMNVDNTPPAVSYELAARDDRAQKTTSAIVHPTTDSSGNKITYQESDIYLRIRELDYSQNAQDAKWIDYVNGLQQYSGYTKYHLDLTPSRQSNADVALGYDFKEIRVFLSMPNDNINVLDGSAILIRDDHTGKHEVVNYDAAKGLDNGYQYMAFTAKASDFSYYTVLVPSTGGSATISVGSDGIVVNINIPSINITIDGNGNVVSTDPNNPSGGTQTNPSDGTQQGQQAQQNQQASPATTIINNYYYGGTIPGNAGDMPTTGGAHMYRVLIVILLGLSGIVEVMLSIPAKRRLRST